MFWFWHHRHTIDLTLCATLLSVIAFFYIWAFLGWVWDEVSWRTKRLVERLKKAFRRKRK